MSNLDTILKRLQKEKIINTQESSEIRAKINQEISTDNRKLLFEELLKTTKEKLRASFKDFNLNEEQFDQLIDSTSNENKTYGYWTLPFPNTFGSLWINIDEAQTEKTLEKISVVIDLFHETQMINKAEKEEILSLMKKENPLFIVRFFMVCQDKL